MLCRKIDFNISDHLCQFEDLICFEIIRFQPPTRVSGSTSNGREILNTKSIENGVSPVFTCNANSEYARCDSYHSEI